MTRGGGEGGRGFSFSRIGGFPDRKVGSMMRGFWARLGSIPGQSPMPNRSACISTAPNIGKAEVRIGWDFGVSVKLPNGYLIGNSIYS